MKLILLQNKDFIKFCKELSDINFKTKGDLKKLNDFKMVNGNTVNDNLVNLIAKIGEKITMKTNFLRILLEKIFFMFIRQLKKE